MRPKRSRQALKEGVACGFGDLFLAQVPPPNGLRISFADKPEQILEEGIRRLAAGRAEDSSTMNSEGLRRASS